MHKYRTVYGRNDQLWIVESVEELKKTKEKIHLIYAGWYKYYKTLLKEQRPEIVHHEQIKECKDNDKEE